MPAPVPYIMVENAESEQSAVGVEKVTEIGG
jgi:hypothetical protein